MIQINYTKRLLAALISAFVYNYSWLWVYSASINHMYSVSERLKATLTSYIVCELLRHPQRYISSDQRIHFHIIPIRSPPVLTSSFCDSHTNTWAAVQSHIIVLCVDSTFNSRDKCFLGRCMYAFLQNRGKTWHIQEWIIPFKCLLDCRWNPSSKRNGI